MLRISDSPENFRSIYRANRGVPVKVLEAQVMAIAPLQEIISSPAAKHLNQLPQAILSNIAKMKKVSDIVDALKQLATVIVETAELPGLKKESEALYDLLLPLDQLITRIRHFNFFSHYGMISEPDPRYKNKPFIGKRLTDGLPKEIIDKLLQNFLVRILYVSGSGPNIWEHAIILLSDGNAIHVNGKEEYLELFNVEELNGFLTHYNKKVTGIQYVKLTNFNDVIVELDSRARKKWNWGGVVHNCLTFCHQILEAGGFKLEAYPEYKGLYFSLPRNFREKTRDADLQKGIDIEAEPRRAFIDSLKRTHNIPNIESLKIAENASPQEAIALLEYILDNVNDVLVKQKAVYLNEVAACGLTASPQQSLQEAGRRIIDKVKDIGVKFNTKYLALITDEKLLITLNNLCSSIEKQVQIHLNPSLMAEHVLRNNSIFKTKTMPSFASSVFQGEENIGSKTMPGFASSVFLDEENIGINVMQ